MSELEKVVFDHLFCDELEQTKEQNWIETKGSVENNDHFVYKKNYK